MCQEVRGGKGQRERRCVVNTDRQPPTALGPTGNFAGFYVWRGNLAAAWRRPAREPGIAYGILRGIPVRPVRLWRVSRRHQKLPITRHPARLHNVAVIRPQVIEFRSVLIFHMAGPKMKTWELQDVTGNYT